MDTPARADRRAAALLTAALVAALLVWNNLLVPRLPGYPGSYVPANLAAAAALLAGARLPGLSWAELGLARRTWSAGLRWGGGCAALVAAAYAVAVAVPGTRQALDGGPDAAGDAGEVLVEVLVRIPLGTVLWEEVAFRAVLLALLLRWLPARTAVMASAAVFGLWHVRTALGGLPVDGGAGRAVSVLLTVLATTAAGVLLAELRLRSGSTLAPALLHLSVNGLGTLAAVAAYRLG